MTQSARGQISKWYDNGGGKFAIIVDGQKYSGFANHVNVQEG